MYNGYDYNGRALKVHFDKFAQPGAPGASTPPVYAAAGGNLGPAMQQQLSAGMGMGRTPSNQSHPTSDLRGSSAAFQMPARPTSAAGAPSFAHPDPTVPERRGPMASPLLRQGPGAGLGDFSGRHPDTWSFLGEHTIDEPNGAAPALDGADVSPTQPAPHAVEDGSVGPAATTKTGKGTGHKPMSIAMPPPYMLAGDGGMMSPPLGKGMGMMTPSMPAFSFQPFPQTPPLMPAQFFSPGIGGLAPFSPPIQSPGWAAPASAGGVPGYNPMFPPTGSYDPTPGGAHVHHHDVDRLGEGHHEMNGYGAHSLGGAMDQLSLDSRPPESHPLETVESADSSHSSTANDAAAGSKILTPGQQQARRASFFGAPGAEKHHQQGGRTGKDRLMAEDLGAGRRASFESGAAAFLGSGRRAAEEV